MAVSMAPGTSTRKGKAREAARARKATRNRTTATKRCGFTNPIRSCRVEQPHGRASPDVRTIPCDASGPSSPHTPPAADPVAYAMDFWWLSVLRHVDDRAVGVADEEAAESPILVRKRVDDLGSRGDSTIVDDVDIIDLDGNIRMDMGLDIEGHDAELDLALVGAEEENPVEAAVFLEPYDVAIKGSAFLEAVGPDVGLDSFDGHVRSVEPLRDPQRTRTSSSRLNPGTVLAAHGYLS